jgi:transcriptional regulator with GAF, ATPase, and Fis domain
MIDENEFFREMTLRICGSLDINQALSQVFNYLQNHIPVDAMGLGYINSDATSIQVVAKVAQKENSYIWAGEGDEIVLPDEAIKFMRTLPPDFPTAFAVNSPNQQHPSMREVYPGIASNSAIFLRLEVQGGLAGVLLISAQGHNRYSAEHAQLLNTVREPFAIAMANARRYREVERMKDLLADDNRALTADIKRITATEVVGADFGLRNVMEMVRQIAPFNSPALLLGETGTGKEVIANAIHMASPRSRKPMITMQCGAVPDSLLDSELFGHEKGAFTGASERKRGRFERADGGTLFLDEIGELSPEAQVKLLRVIQEQQFERVGGTKNINVDVRVIAATHRDLEQMVRQGEFREDLWYRLNVLPIRIPPLRLRQEDIPSLVQYFVDRKAQEMNLLQVPRIPRKTLGRLQAYDWPGNVRELQNIVERALILSNTGTLLVPKLSTHPQMMNSKTINLQEMMRPLDDVIAEHIHLVLDHVQGRISGKGGAADILKMNPSTLYFRMKKLGINRGRK